MPSTPEMRLAIALAIGLLIGAERERRKGDGATRGPAGLRTFAILALLGGVVAIFDSIALLAVVGAAVGAVIVTAYVLGDRSDPGLTTEVTALLTYFLGALAMREPGVALAAGVAVAALLAFRATLHSAVRSVLSESELQDALLFAFAAVAVLPLIPNHTIDPFDVVNPFVLWRLVVLLMAMSGAGYVAERVVGPRYGLALAGFGSGFVSSSATIAAMGSRARADAAVLRPAVAGAAASTVATFVQLAILVGAASPSLLAALKWPLLAGGTTALVYAAVQTFGARRAEVATTKGRAFRLSSALLFAGLVTVVVLISTLAQRWLGAAGAVATAALAGFADAHASSAAVASVAATDHISLAWGQIGVLLALTTNTITKAVLSITSGPRSYAWRVIIGLGLVLAVVWGVAALGFLL